MIIELGIARRRTITEINFTNLTLTPSCWAFSSFTSIIVRGLAISAKTTSEKRTKEPEIVKVVHIFGPIALTISSEPPSV